MTYRYVADYHSRHIEIVDGEGCELIEAQGKRYLDFVAGWCVGNIGWGRQDVAEAIKREALRGRYVPQFLQMREQEEFAELLIKHAPGTRLRRVFRCTSGSESVEFAIKLARAATQKSTIVSIDGVYHGHTYGAASVGDACREETSLFRKFRCGGMTPCLSGFVKLPMPDGYRGPDAGTVIGAFETLVSQRQDIAAFLSEPVWTNAGAYVPSADFYPRIQEICRQRGILLIMDEVATGFGRCGTLFGSELWELEPDIVCLGKGLTGGYGTMGATLVSEQVYVCGERVPHYSTFGWVPTDLAAARANVEVILRDRLWERAAGIGQLLRQAFSPLERLPFVGQVRGVGLVMGIEIVKSRRSKEPDYARAVAIQEACAERGLLVETAGNVIFLTPPLVLSEAEAERGAGIIRGVLGMTRSGEPGTGNGEGGL